MKAEKDFFKYSKEDFIAAFALFAVVLLFLLFYIDSCTLCVDEYPAYISQGIAIAEGRFDEQALFNLYVCPDELPETADRSSKTPSLWSMRSSKASLCHSMNCPPLVESGVLLS